MTQAEINRAMQTALANHRAGKLPQAEEICRQILKQHPDHADALHMLGTLTAQAGKMDVAIDLIRRAMEINPNVAEYHNNLGSILRETGRLDEAISANQHAIKLKPDFAAAHFNLGNMLHAKGLMDQAIASYRNAIRLHPLHVLAHNNLGIALREKGLFDEAIASFRQILILNPNLAEGHNNLGNALREKGSPDEAIDVYRHALALNPNLAATHNNLGIAFYNKCQPIEATAAYREALRLKPDYAEAHHNLATALLLNGDFKEGLTEYEWRWRWKGMAPPRPEYSKPRWDGSPLNGKTIILHFEGGFGDTIQFVRYAPMVASRGGKVLLDCQPELIPLMRGMPGVEQLLAADAPLPPFDQHCGLLSLPLVFGTTLKKIPAAIPYLKVNENLSKKWAARLPTSGELKVGIVWAGNPNHMKDRNRSLHLSQLAPLAKVSGVKFFSLQKGEPARQTSTSPQDMDLTDYSAKLNNFSETAALIANLDLVIAADTAVAHVAGAIGTPVWLLTPFAPDWRWLIGRTDTPWYPTMRLFRQTNLGDWPEVIERASITLHEFRDANL